MTDVDDFPLLQTFGDMSCQAQPLKSDNLKNPTGKRVPPVDLNAEGSRPTNASYLNVTRGSIAKRETKAIAFSAPIPAVERTTKAGTYFFSLADDLKTLLAKPYANVLCGRFKGRRKAIAEVHRTLEEISPMKDHFHVATLDEREVLIRFQSRVDFIRVYCRNCITVDGVPMRIHRWRPSLQNVIDPRLVAAWIIFPALPLHLQHPALLKSMGKKGPHFNPPMQMEATEKAVEGGHVSWVPTGNGRDGKTRFVELDRPTTRAAADPPAGGSDFGELYSRQMDMGNVNLASDLCDGGSIKKATAEEVFDASAATMSVPVEVPREDIGQQGLDVQRGNFRQETLEEPPTERNLVLEEPKEPDAIPFTPVFEVCTPVDETRPADATVCSNRFKPLTDLEGELQSRNSPHGMITRSRARLKDIPMSGRSADWHPVHSEEEEDVISALRDRVDDPFYTSDTGIEAYTEKFLLHREFFKPNKRKPQRPRGKQYRTRKQHMENDSPKRE